MVNGFQRSDTAKLSHQHHLVDDQQRKLIADEAERLANLLPPIGAKKLQGRNPMGKDVLVSG